MHVQAVKALSIPTMSFDMMKYEYYGQFATPVGLNVGMQGQGFSS